MPSAPRGDFADRVGRVTIIDVGRRAGVSKSTVSLVLSGSELVAEATKLRVNEAMRALGYVYHRGAASLRAASSDLVGMIMGDLTTPSSPSSRRGLRTRSFNVALRRSLRTQMKTRRARRRCSGRCASTTSPASS